MYINRQAEILLEKIVSGKKAGIILGARQVGKTTLVEHVLRSRKAFFLNFDIEVDKARFKAASALPPVDAVRSFGNPDVLVIDEAQRLPEASRIVKGWIDTRLPVRFLLLGSSSLNLLDQTTESLTGRNRKLVLPPLLFSETLQTQSWADEGFDSGRLREHFAPQLRAYLMQRLAFGSYPEVVTSEEPIQLLRELSSDYLWKDILQTGLVKNPALIKRLLLLLAHQSGSEVSVNELATQLQMARPTVNHYLDLLEHTFVIFRLDAFSTNPRKEISKSKKVFFWDTGIRNALLNTFTTNEFRPDIGSLWENWVIAEAAKQNAMLGCPVELFFWRTRSQSKVDLVVKHEQSLQAFEIKWASSPPFFHPSGGSPSKQPYPSPDPRHCRAFRNAYGVDVETIRPNNPFLHLFGPLSEH